MREVFRSSMSCRSYTGYDGKLGNPCWTIKSHKSELNIYSSPQMWATFNSLEDTVAGDDAYQSRADALPTAVPAAERLVAIGDIHGDYHKAVRAFRLAGLTDEQGRWSGGSTVAVQVSEDLARRLRRGTPGNSEKSNA